MIIMVFMLIRHIKAYKYTCQHRKLIGLLSLHASVAHTQCHVAMYDDHSCLVLSNLLVPTLADEHGQAVRPDQLAHTARLPKESASKLLVLNLRWLLKPAQVCQAWARSCPAAAPAPDQPQPDQVAVQVPEQVYLA